MRKSFNCPAEYGNEKLSSNVCFTVVSLLLHYEAEIGALSQIIFGS